jgi:predicted ester cyclase
MTSPEQNKAAALAEFEIWGHGNLDEVDELAEGDRVATRWLATMTPAEGPASGKQVELRGITIERFEDGKVVEAWRSMDMLGLLRQLGTIPS